jgi:hypothetical protein
VNVWSSCLCYNCNSCDDSLLDDDAIRSKYYQCCRNHYRIILEELLHTSAENRKGHLKVLRGTVEEIRFDGNMAVGLTYRDYESNILINISTRNGGEVIICAGVFESARIVYQNMMLYRQSSETQSSSNTEQPNIVALFANLGQLQDHIHIPMICIGNWSKLINGRKLDHRTNGIHGWIYLDADGKIYDSSSSSIPPK